MTRPPPATRYEVHFGQRLVRCFADRPNDVDALLRDAVARWPDRTALVLGDAELTYRDLDASVTSIAANLMARGLAPGDRIAILLGNGFAFVKMVLAAARAGLIVVPMNVLQRSPETTFVLNQCAAKALVFDAACAPNLPADRETPSVAHWFIVGEGQGTPFAELERAASASFPTLDEESVFCLLYTSGTTGKPKGAMLSHLGTVHSALHFADRFDLMHNDVAALAVPASHVTGLVAITLTMIRAGGATLIMPAFKARNFLEIAEMRGMTYTLIVPAMYNLCLLEPEFGDFDLSAWRIAGFGGAPMPEATITGLAKTLPGLSLRNAYGSTETTSPATLMALGDINISPASVGRALPCADVLIMRDDGVEAEPGEAGELLIGGPMVVEGYWDNPEANSASFIGGYWVSGDIGSKDADGFVYVFDRKKDMVNRAGYKVYCIEVESTLSLHNAVIECAVIGVPDPVLGEKTHIFIHAHADHPDAGGIRSWCAERLSKYKVPDLVTFLDGPLPRNANGKILKTALRDQSA